MLSVMSILSRNKIIIILLVMFVDEMHAKISSNNFYHDFLLYLLVIKTFRLIITPQLVQLFHDKYSIGSLVISIENRQSITPTFP